MPRRVPARLEEADRLIHTAEPRGVPEVIAVYVGRLVVVALGR